MLRVCPLLAREGSAIFRYTPNRSKGVRGPICSFLITTNEKRTAEIDRAFRFIAVTNALESNRRKLVTFTGKELLREFDFSPITFRATPKRDR